MRAETRERIEEHFKVFSKWMIGKEGVEPELAIREGEKATAVLEQISEDKEVGVLVLGACAGSSPGPLVTQLVTKLGGDMTVPITVVPGAMTKEAIIAVS